MSALFSLFMVLPAIYSSGCHAKATWSLSKYPGATFATFECLISLSCLALLLLAAVLTWILNYVPRLFLRTLPAKYLKARRRFYDW